MKAGTLGLAFLAEASSFPSDYNFLFTVGIEECKGLLVTEVGASLGDFLGESELSLAGGSYMAY